MAEYIPKLGEAPTEKDERDAIHIAVVPVIAAQNLVPGEHVGFARSPDGKIFAAPSTCSAGIVDPFRKSYIRSGERTWALLYPGTAIGLRHVYRHPALDPT